MLVSNNTDLSYLQSKTAGLELQTSKMPISGVFEERKGSYINEFNLFIAHFNIIPNFIHELRIDCKKANKWFVGQYENDITNVYFNKRYLDGKTFSEYDDIFYFLYEDLIVDFDTNNDIVRFLFRKTEMAKVESIAMGIKKYRERKEKEESKISLLMDTGHGIRTKSLEINKPKLSIDDNYNDDFKAIHQLILKRLSKKNDKGIVLLHGKPGTGKTSYIRCLITMLKKDVIFLPPNMAAAIIDPNLISILIDNPNSIFVIEDAENIVVDRERKGHSPVSALLNISDGLLSDCLNIQIICSFNTDISKVDNALLRKGRLIAKYEFKELETAKAQSLSDKLLFNKKIFKPMVLTDIYNQDETDFEQANKRNTIGFLAN